MKKQKGALRSGVLGNPLEMGFWILEQWLSLRQKQKNLIPFFQDNFIKTIAIYGMGGVSVNGSTRNCRTAKSRFAMRSTEIRGQRRNWTSRFMV